MKCLKERFTLATRHLCKDKTYLAGVSGGRDSVVLVHLLKAAGFQKIVICHLNHGLRKTADRDVLFVKKLAVISNMRFIYDIIPKLSKSNSLESRLRNERLAFFTRSGKEVSAEGVFLGHHADDLAETFLWNLLRGGGAAGLTGIQTETQIITPAGGIRLIRPLLDFWRSEIDAYISENGLVFVEDETNRARKFTRNRLRHDILPWLEKKLGRNVSQNLHRTAAILKEENGYLEKQTLFFEANTPLSVAILLAQPVALQRRNILKWLQINEILEAGFEEVELVRSLLDLENGPARINLTQNRQARRRAGKIALAKQSE